MLGKILDKSSCAKCRICCGFVEYDKWEIPLVFTEMRGAVEKKLGINLIPRGNEFVFDMKFNGDTIVYCPAASENGCTLGELKPFDCLIWPFRVNRLGTQYVITVSPICKTVSALPLSKIMEFIHTDGFAERLFEESHKHPDMVKPYIDGYPIVAVENVNQN